jgi:hypothetical protein
MAFLKKSCSSHLPHLPEQAPFWAQFIGWTETDWVSRAANKKQSAFGKLEHISVLGCHKRVRGCYFGLRPQIGKKQIVPSCIWRPLPFWFPGLAAGRRPAAHYSSSFSSPIAFGAVGTVSGFAHSEKSFAHADAGLNGERAWADKWMRCFIRNNSLLSLPTLVGSWAHLWEKIKQRSECSD